MWPSRQLPTCQPRKFRAVYLRLSVCLALSVCHLLVPISRLALANLSCRPLSLDILQKAQRDVLQPVTCLQAALRHCSMV